jgi:hypothetical protein
MDSPIQIPLQKEKQKRKKAIHIQAQKRSPHDQKAQERDESQEQ